MCIKDRTSRPSLYVHSPRLSMRYLKQLFRKDVSPQVTPILLKDGLCKVEASPTCTDEPLGTMLENISNDSYSRTITTTASTVIPPILPTDDLSEAEASSTCTDEPVGAVSENISNDSYSRTTTATASTVIPPILPTDDLSEAEVSSTCTDEPVSAMVGHISNDSYAWTTTATGSLSRPSLRTPEIYESEAFSQIFFLSQPNSCYGYCVFDHVDKEENAYRDPFYGAESYNLLARPIVGSDNIDDGLDRGYDTTIPWL